jgi:hypothetical protein
LFNASGPWGAALLLFVALGAPIQVAVGGLVGLRRPVPAAAALLVPLLVLILGLAGMAAGMDAGVAAIHEASDPAWVSWFALDDRARATAPLVLGGGAAAALALPVAIGAAWAALRAGKGLPASSRTRAADLALRWGLPLLVLVVAGLTAAGEAFAASIDVGGRPLYLPAVGTLPFALCAAFALRPAAHRRLGGVAAGFGALVIASAGLGLAAWGLTTFGSTAALGDFAAPFAAVGEVAARTRDTWWVRDVAAGCAVAFVVGALPALLARSWRTLDARSGLDALGAGALALLAVLVGGFGGARAAVLTRLAGAQPAAVLQAAALQSAAPPGRPALDVPALAPLPARVLVGDDHPRWLVLRDRGGVETLPLAGALDILGPALLRDDGLMLPPALTLEDFYLALFGTSAGAISIVGCSPVPPALLADIRRDPLLATGRCAAFPLHLQVTTALEDPRVLIALKDHLVDDGGEIVAADAVPDVVDRDVILRGQLDATVADLVAVLHTLAPARRVYLGFGVTLDGDDLPIGVDPGLRIRAEAPGVQPLQEVPESAIPTPAAP